MNRSHGYQGAPAIVEQKCEVQKVEPVEQCYETPQHDDPDLQPPERKRLYPVDVFA